MFDVAILQALTLSLLVPGEFIGFDEIGGDLHHFCCLGEA